MIVEASPRAERQIRSARRWWLQNRDKAPEAFDEEILRARELLTLERIRYYLFYRVHPDRVEIASLWHASRRPPRL